MSDEGRGGQRGRCMRCGGRSRGRKWMSIAPATGAGLCCLVFLRRVSSRSIIAVAKRRSLLYFRPPAAMPSSPLHPASSPRASSPRIVAYRCPDYGIHLRSQLVILAPVTRLFITPSYLSRLLPPALPASSSHSTPAFICTI